MAKPFCRECGRGCIEWHNPNLGYDTFTGKKITSEFRCPSGLCGHYGYEFHQWVQKWFWWPLSMFGWQNECSRCKKIY